MFRPCVTISLCVLPAGRTVSETDSGPFRYRRSTNDSTTTPSPEKPLDPVIYIAPPILIGIPLLVILIVICRSLTCSTGKDDKKDDSKQSSSGGIQLGGNKKVAPAHSVELEDV